MPPATAMRIAAETEVPTCLERDIYESKLPLDGARILELGCGRAEHTRKIATAGSRRQVLALEVDEIQHARNCEITDLPNVTFALGGAQAIPAADASVDVVLMFKSLHHVPVELMAASLREIARVLRPGGHAYISEPIFAGRYNEVLRLFHDESRVRAAAFDAVRDAVAAGVLELEEEIFFNAPVSFPDFAAFERLVINVTHTQHRLAPELHARVKAEFERSLTPTGVRFEAPMRIDLLRKPAA